jgi:hypothetical protein
MKTSIHPSRQRLNTCLLAGLMAAGSFCAMAQSGQIRHLPEAVEVISGETFEITVEVDPAGNPVSVVDLRMQFDPAYLEVIELSALLSSLSANVVAPAFDNTTGTISMGAFELGESLPTGSFPLLQITFRALDQPGNTSVEHPQSIFPKTVMAYAGTDQLQNIGPLEVSISSSEVVSTLDRNVDGLGLGIWPNPAADYTFIAFQTEHAAMATLEIYDLNGKMIEQLFRGSATPGLQQRFELNVQHLASGMYMCKLATNHASITKKLIVSR